MYEQLITSDTFTGVRADVLSGAMGWIGVVLGIAGVGLIIRVLIPR